MPTRTSASDAVDGSSPGARKRPGIGLTRIRRSHRTRPYNLPVLKDSPSYPSGHTTYGTLMGTILARMLPEKRDELYARITDYGHSRMIAGVHYRSDIDAGKGTR